MEATASGSGVALSSPPPNPLLLRLRDRLGSCAKSVESGDSYQTERLVSELAKFLGDVSVAAEDENTHEDAFELLSHVYEYISSSSIDQELLDALSFELPKAVSKFSGVSRRFLTIAESIIHQFLVKCNPRDMLPILCEALDSSSEGEKIKLSGYFGPLLSGLSEVLLMIKRHHFEQTKEVVPAILRVWEKVSTDADEEDSDLEDLFRRGINIANSMQTVHQKLDSGSAEKLLTLLGLYVLQMMTHVSICVDENVSSSLRLVTELSHFLRCCRLSYIGLITGSAIDMMTSTITDEEDSFWDPLPSIKLGAALSVIWGDMSDKVAHNAEEDLTAVKNEIRCSQTRRWQAIGMLRHVFCSATLPWRLKKHAIDFLLCITEGDISPECESETLDFSSFVSSHFAALQGIENVIMYTSDSVLRKKAFDVLKRVLADIPISQRFDVLKALITNCNSASMVAILLDIVRQVRHAKTSSKVSNGNVDEVFHETPVWSADVLELVELVLRPSKGGPPSLPEQSDAVLSALNLYRFVLLSESTGKTNYTGVLSETNLKKAYNEWLLPLRTLVTGILAENRNDDDPFSSDSVSALNPVELVLYRCIELVEERLKHDL
ncbi:aberrant root formation protein 4 isoform X1 [Rhodamnia argentea]|uniref:Aberrant root formation protein 4 isoform X1 n=1 Tax=Rhodamnia argentea TaxID=178133 RepID=A0A8B8PIV2_9MYRT|nr:aberrant root formation protein 4 isoform X1 [Rhodamnia argentea]